MLCLYIVGAFVALNIGYRVLSWIWRVGNYSSRYVFITGCDTGFGNELAKRLDKMGFHVFAACLTEKGADNLRKESSSNVKTLLLDVSKESEIGKAREFVERNLPAGKGLWAIVNNAGIAGPAALCPWEWVKRHDYEETFKVNLFGMIDVCRIFMPLVRREMGRVINTSSIAGRLACGNPAYTSTKYGVEGFSDILRLSLRSEGMTVHIVEPEGFKTNIFNLDAQHRNCQRAFDSLPEEVKSVYGESYIDKTNELVDRFVQTSSSATYMVVDAYVHAITSQLPRTRYLVGYSANFIFHPLWMLPSWITDPLLANMFIPKK